MKFKQTDKGVTVILQGGFLFYLTWREVNELKDFLNRVGKYSKEQDKTFSALDMKHVIFSRPKQQ